MLELPRRSFAAPNVSRDGERGDPVGGPVSTLSQIVARVRKCLFEEESLSPCAGSNMYRRTGAKARLVSGYVDTCTSPR